MSGAQVAPWAYAEVQNHEVASALIKTTKRVRVRRDASTCFGLCFVLWGIA
jgi:hypothetical protein